MSTEELGFTPQPATRWLAPRVLVGTGIKALLASIFGAYADKRELQGSLPSTVHHHTDPEEFWIDYVADLGDGFDATFSIASLLAADQLDVAGRAEPLRRGHLLVMGGDSVYPHASTQGYSDRTKGVYRAAFPVPQGDPPTLFSLPGNHDWYDGLTAFLRVFAQRRPFGGWQTAQTRSYFAIELPHRWWLFAIDTQFDDHMDAPQLEYFRTVAAELREGDTVILCTPSPSWLEAGSGGSTDGYDAFEFFDREIIHPTGARVALMLSGDKHHYSRYAEVGGERQLITCGLGGAYLTATHFLPDELVLPPARTRVRQASPQTRYTRERRYPSKQRSELFAAGILRLPLRNPGFWGMAGIAQTLMTLVLLYGMVATVQTGLRGLFGILASWGPPVIAAGGVVIISMAFARLDAPSRMRGSVIAGVLHAGAHLVLAALWAYAVFWMHRNVLPDNIAGDLMALVIVLVGTPTVIGFLDAEVTALYLMVASRFGINLNEVMAGQSIEDHKGFLRLHIDRSGTLRVYPVKVEEICRSWRPNPDGAPHEPWMVPDGEPLRAELIEQPVTVRLGRKVHTQA